MKSFEVQLDHKDAVIPTRAHVEDAGFDLYLPEDVCIWPRSLQPINTYVRLKLEPGYEAQVRSRSGLALKKNLFVLNSPGTIDCFSEDMSIKTIEGDKQVTDIHIGEIVPSMNEDTLEVERDIISAIIDKGQREIYVIEMDDGNILEYTGNTMVYTSRGVIYAKDLKKDDGLMCF